MVSRLVLALIALTIGYACLEHGGVTSREWGFCLLSIAVCGLSLPGRSQSPPLHPVLLAALALCPLIVGLQIVAFSVAPSITFAHLERLLAYLVVFFVARSMTVRGWWLAAPVILVGTLEAVLGLAQFFSGMGRAYGTYVNPNHFAALLNMSLPFAAMGAVRAMRRRTGELELPASRVALSCLLMACAAVILLGTLFSLSRMGLATMLACGAIAGWLAFSRGRLRMVAALIPLAVLAVVLLTAPGALADRFTVTPEARLQFWRETLRLIAAYPALGCGLGTYASAIQMYRNSAPLMLLDFAHNDYLQLIAELGIVGFIPFALAGAWIFVQPWRRSRHRSLAIACAASLSAIALESAVDFDFYIPANMLVAAWVAGVGFRE